MNRAVTVGGAVLGSVALLGVGVAVGTQVGQDEATVVAEAAAQVPQGFEDPQEALRLQAFINSAADFQALLDKATKGKTDVGEAMIQQAVLVRGIKRTAKTPELRDAADALSQAMLLLSAGFIADEGYITDEGIEVYKAADVKVKALSEKVIADQQAANPSPSPSAP